MKKFLILLSTILLCSCTKKINNESSYQKINNMLVNLSARQMLNISQIKILSSIRQFNIVNLTVSIE